MSHSARACARPCHVCFKARSRRRKPPRSCMLACLLAGSHCLVSRFSRFSRTQLGSPNTPVSRPGADVAHDSPKMPSMTSAFDLFFRHPPRIIASCGCTYIHPQSTLHGWSQASKRTGPKGMGHWSLCVAANNDPRTDGSSCGRARRRKSTWQRAFPSQG
jgi:hypothetical protein